MNRNNLPGQQSFLRLTYTGPHPTLASIYLLHVRVQHGALCARRCERILVGAPVIWGGQHEAR